MSINIRGMIAEFQDNQQLTATMEESKMTTNFYVLPTNLERACRICLTESSNLSPIFHQNEVNAYSDLSHKIQQCGAIEIHERDGLPSLICDVCIYKATVAHEFRQQCQSSDAKLRLYYDKPLTRTNSMDTSTQTDTQLRILVTKKVTDQQAYYVKEEMQNIDQELTNHLEVYTQNHHQAHGPMDHTVITHPTVDTTMAPEDEFLLCQIGFDNSKEMEKNTVILEAPVHSNSPTNEVLLEVPSENPLVEVQQTITEIKTSEAAEYLNEHLLNTTTTTEEDGEDDGQHMVADDAFQDEEDDDDENEHLEQQQTEQSEHPEHHEQLESELTEQISNNPGTILPDIATEIEAEVETVSKRPMRKAKPIAGKSYSVDDYDGEYQELGDDDQGELKYKCRVCHERYSTMKGLKNHAQVHDKNYKCPTCTKPFYKLVNMEKHRKLHETKPHACQICYNCFTKPQSLVRHMKHHDKSENSNENGDLKKNDKLENHSEDDDRIQQNESDEFDNAPGIYKCDVCNQFCSSMKNLKRHALVHGEKKYSCTVCEKWFFRPDTLKKHAEKHGHGLLDNLVDENKLFDSDDDFPPRRDTDNQAKKEESDEDGGTGEYKCQHCDKVMATMKGLRRHVSMHKPKAEPVTCEICKKVCASQARLALHQKTHNKPKEKVPREYLCHICSKVYPSNSSLTYHMRTHTGVKPHVCKICNSGFTTTTSLANHTRIHTGDKPFVCHVCSAAFAVSSAFRRHLTRHTGEANYLCKTCGKAFKRLSTLKEHTYTHSGEKPYVCKTCGAAYSHSGSLFAHQKRCRAQYGEMPVPEEQHHNVVSHHIHVNNVPTAVRSLAVIGQMF